MSWWPVAVVLLTALVAGTSLAWTGRLAAPGAYRAIPQYWHQTADWLDAHRMPAAPQRPVKVVVGVDPADSGERDAAGIVAASIASDGTVAVIADATGQYTAEQWARAAVDLAVDLGASEIAIEGFAARVTYVKVVENALARVKTPHPIRITSWPPKGSGRGGGDAMARSAALLQGLEVGTVRIAGHLPDLEDAAVGWQAGQHQPDQIAALVFGNGGAEILPALGPEPRRAAAIEPVEFALHPEEHPAQHQRSNAIGMGLGIGKGQCRPPAATEEGPARDTENLPDRLDIADQMRRGIRLDAGGGARAAAAALVEEDDPVMSRVEEAPHERAAAPAGAAMQHQHRLAIGIAALLDVELMPVAAVDHALVIGADVGIKPPGCRADLSCQSVHGRSIDRPRQTCQPKDTP